MNNDNLHAIILGVVTVAFLILAGFLVYTFRDNGPIDALAFSIITGLLGLWIPSPAQSKS
jgi:hypothetical protein